MDIEFEDSSRCKHRNAFTLIELLVVSSSIALLTARLLPALAKPKRTGQTAVGVSDLNELGVVNLSLCKCTGAGPQFNP